MLWLVLGLACAFFYAINHLVTKRAVSDQPPQYVVYLKLLLTAILTLPAVILIWGRFELNMTFFFAMIAIAVIILIAQVLYMTSLKLSPISKSVPLLSLTPLFVVPFGLVMVGELPGLLGIAGVFLIVFGTYVLNVEKATKRRFLEPFLYIFRNKGVRCMLIVALIYGFSSVLDKFTINHSNVLSRLLLYTYFVVPLQTAFLLFKDRGKFALNVKRTFSSVYGWLILIVVLEFLVIATQFTALTLTYTAYVIALKRSSAIFSVILAYFFFREKENFFNCMLGTAILVAGVILLVT